MRLRERLWNPYIVVFISSACIMVIELVASRFIAPRMGVSLYTWTTIIGVILAGISLGNYLGGLLADRLGKPFFLGVLFALAALGSLSILWLNNDIFEIQLPNTLPLMVWVIGYIAGIYFLPSTILGCISPLVVKLSLTDLQRTGSTVGKIYAWSTVGSIVGTFATGFFLISWFGTKTIVLGVAAIQMLMGVWFLTHTRWWKATLALIVALGLFGGALWFLYSNDYMCKECLRETNYFCIKVNERDVDGHPVRELVLDRLVHSYSNLDDPTYLGYGYERIYARVIQPLMDSKPELATFFIGGGGYTFPRYIEAKLPQSHIVVAEIDPGVTEIAYQELGLPRDTRIESVNLDARIHLLREGKLGSYDLVFGDAFNDYSVPYHLTTLEFDQMVKKLLREDGLYVINIIDGGPRGHFLRAYVRTLQQVFKYVSVIPASAGWEESPRMTFVIVASDKPHDLSRLETTDVLLTTQQLNEYLDKEKPLILRDEYVPVDNLLAPVFEDSFKM